jgi:hypothetical protein
MTTTQPAFFTSFSLFSDTSVKNDVVLFEDVTREKQASFTISRVPLFPRSRRFCIGESRRRMFVCERRGGGGINTSNPTTYAPNFLHIFA